MRNNTGTYLYRKIHTFIFTLVLIIAIGQKTSAQCNGTYMEVIAKDSSYMSKCNDMIVMNLQTYSHYYKIEKNFNNLKLQIPKYDSIVNAMDKLNKENLSDLDSIVEVTSENIKLEKQSKQEAIALSESLEKDNIKLTQKNFKLKDALKKVAIVAISETIIIIIWIVK